MNLNQPWNIVFLIGFIIYVGIRHKFSVLTKDNEKTFSRIDTLEKILLFIVLLGNILLPAIYLLSRLLAFADYALPRFVPWIGSVIMVVSLWLFRRSHTDLGKNWSISLEMRKDHQLIRNGVYRLIRHPMYASIWLFTIAQALLLQNWIAGPSAVVTFAPLYFLRTPREEQMMREAFGKEYEDYIRQTGRVFPRLK